MLKLSTDMFTAIEKITSFRLFMTLISLALFIEFYLFYNYSITIGQLNTNWIKTHSLPDTFTSHFEMST
jgi:hypothetical protein